MQINQRNAFDNLTWLCSIRKSVSQVCREIGLNRQQFARYLSGKHFPSPHTWRRICEHFGTDISEIGMPPDQFRERFMRRSDSGHEALASIGGMLGLNLAVLRPYAGFYQVYFKTPSRPDDVVCALTELTECAGYMNVKTIERLHHTHSSHETFSYTGFASWSRDRLMAIEVINDHGEPILTETILEPSENAEIAYLTGIALTLSWQAGHRPYCTPAIWRYLGPVTDVEAAIENCGRKDLKSPVIPLKVRKFFASAPDTFSLFDQKIIRPT